MLLSTDSTSTTSAVVGSANRLHSPEHHRYQIALRSRNLSWPAQGFSNPRAEFGSGSTLLLYHKKMTFTLI